MIANEMRRHFHLLRDGDATVDREYDDKEVGMWLTKSQDKIVDSKTFGSPSIEQGSLRDAELYQVKVHTSIDGTSFVSTDKYENAFETALPSDYLYNLSESVDITYSKTTTPSQYKRVAIKVIEEDNYNEFIKSWLHRPYRRLLWRITERGKIQGDEIQSDSPKTLILIGDEHTTIDKYYCSYVKRPQPIVVDIMNPANQQHCELPDAVHMDIVELAVRMSMAATGSPKYQLALNEEKD